MKTEKQNKKEFIKISIENGMNKSKATKLYETLKEDRLKRLGW